MIIDVKENKEAEGLDDLFKEMKEHTKKIVDKKMSFIELINNAKYYGSRGYRFGAVKDVAKMVAYSMAVILKAKEREGDEEL